jgi:hypothetical protein
MDTLCREMLHALAWMMWNSHATHLHRSEIDAGALTLEPDVPNGAAFRSLLEEQDEQTADALRALNLLDCGERGYDGIYICRFTFAAPTLRAELSNMAAPNLLNVERLIPAFLVQASMFGGSFRSYRDGREALASLPIVQVSFELPSHFAVYVHALCDEGYCAHDANGYVWTRKIRPHMETARLWEGFNTRDELREHHLKKIWDTMPEALKRPFLQSGKNLDVLSFAFAMGHFFYDDRWHTTPEHPRSFADGDLRGGFIPVADEIDTLIKAGKIRF